MERHASFQRRWGTILFLIGFFVGAWLLGGVTWANLEASLFDSGKVGDNLTTLRCSLIITPDEAAHARLTLQNPLDRPIKRFVRWRIAQRHLLLVDETKESVAQTPGERLVLEIALSPEHGVFGGRFLMVSVFVSSAYPLAALEGNCGTWIIDIPFLDGIHILILGGLFAVLGMTLGFWLRYRNRPPERSSEGALLAMLAFFLAGMIAITFFTWWVLAGVMFLLMWLTLALWVFQRIDERWLQVKPPID